jgi:hypothetical protein
VIGNIPNDSQLRGDIKDSLLQLSSYVLGDFDDDVLFNLVVRTLDRIGTEIKEIQKESTVSRLLSRSSNSDQMPNMKQHLDEAIKILTVRFSDSQYLGIFLIGFIQLRMAVTTGVDVARITNDQQKNALVNQKNHVTTSKHCECNFNPFVRRFTSKSGRNPTMHGNDR